MRTALSFCIDGFPLCMHKAPVPLNALFAAIYSHVNTIITNDGAELD